MIETHASIVFLAREAMNVIRARLTASDNALAGTKAGNG